MGKVSDLIGKTVLRVKNHDNEEITFDCADGSRYKMCHLQDCCEDVRIDVRIEEIHGDLQDLVGKIIVAREDTGEWVDTQQSATWTFYNLATCNGWVTIRWLGESNGYYSEEVDFIQIKSSKEEMTTITKILNATAGKTCQDRSTDQSRAYHAYKYNYRGK